MPTLKCGNLVILLHRQSNLVQTVEQALFAEGINLKGQHHFLVLIPDALSVQVYIQSGAWVLL